MDASGAFCENLKDMAICGKTSPTLVGKTKKEDFSNNPVIFPIRSPANNEIYCYDVNMKRIREKQHKMVREEQTVEVTKSNNSRAIHNIIYTYLCCFFNNNKDIFFNIDGLFYDGCHRLYSTSRLELNDLARKRIHLVATMEGCRYEVSITPSEANFHLAIGEECDATVYDASLLQGFLNVATSKALFESYKTARLVWDYIIPYASKRLMSESGNYQLALGFKKGTIAEVDHENTPEASLLIKFKYFVFYHNQSLSAFARGFFAEMKVFYANDIFETAVLQLSRYIKGLLLETSDGHRFRALAVKMESRFQRVPGTGNDQIPMFSIGNVLQVEESENCVSRFHLAKNCAIVPGQGVPMNKMSLSLKNEVRTRIQMSPLEAKDKAVRLLYDCRMNDHLSAAGLSVALPIVLGEQ